ncbi:Fic family protein [Halomonas sp. TBZ9]|uniref:Fic family protein n=1 Tax=Vreelandella azerica TaxID=2732867 RepID=A0A7Y3TZF8_9GAMM|nr:Fic family protein [Halomonas azerica]
MHEQLTAHQDFTEALTTEGKIIKVALLKGQYKNQPNNPKRQDGSIHEYCPPELIIDEMERFVALYSRYEEAHIAPEILSAWLHHRFTQIHPFQDGNGRIARAIASLVFLKSGLFPLVIRDSDREIQYFQH